MLFYICAGGAVIFGLLHSLFNHYHLEKSEGSRRAADLCFLAAAGLSVTAILIGLIVRPFGAESGQMLVAFLLLMTVMILACRQDKEGEA